MRKKDRNIIIQTWRKFFEAKGIDRIQVDAYMEYVTNLLSQDLPPIFDFRHLCLLLGIKCENLASMVNSPNDYYRIFDIPKKSGGFRSITAPYPSLKLVQRWIYDNILRQIPVHGCAHGFINKRSTLTNVKVHVGQKCLLKIDLKDFFPSILISWVIQMFRKLGYEKYVAFYLASLCCYDGRLAQGSPVSPIISNIVARHLDRRLYRIAKKLNLKYSRYADDIAFSGDSINVKMIDYIEKIISDCGFIVNTQKIRLYKEFGNKILTGISLSSGEPRLPRDYRRNLEKELYFIDKYGLNSHISHNKIRNPRYLESLIGKVGYWLMIEPDNAFAKNMKNKLENEYANKLVNVN